MARSRLSCVNTVDDREKAHAAEKKDDFGSGPLKPDIFLSSFHPFFFFLSQPLTFLPLNVLSQPPASVKNPKYLVFRRLAGGRFFQGVKFGQLLFKYLSPPDVSTHPSWPSKGFVCAG